MEKLKVEIYRAESLSDLEFLINQVCTRREVIDVDVKLGKNEEYFATIMYIKEEEEWK